MTTLSSYAILAVVAQSAMSDVVLTEADAGSTRQVKRGETVELRLKESPSTGYRWTIDVEPPDAATIAASSQEPGGLGLGANGVHVFKIAAKGSGTVTLNAKLWRSWEGEGSAVERKSFTLEVR